MEILDSETLDKKVTSAIYDHRKRLDRRQDRQISHCDANYFLDGSKRRKLEVGSFSICSFQW